MVGEVRDAGFGLLELRDVEHDAVLEQHATVAIAVGVRPVTHPDDAPVRPDHAVVVEVAALAVDEGAGSGPPREPGRRGAPCAATCRGRLEYASGDTPRISSICGFTYSVTSPSSAYTTAGICSTRLAVSRLRLDEGDRPPRGRRSARGRPARTTARTVPERTAPAPRPAGHPPDAQRAVASKSRARPRSSRHQSSSSRTSVPVGSCPRSSTKPLVHGFDPVPAHDEHGLGGRLEQTTRRRGRRRAGPDRPCMSPMGHRRAPDPT